MKYPLLIIFLFFVSFLLHAQEREDTIICGRHYVVIEIPEISYKHKKIQNYEEGFFITYPNIDGSYLLIHYGSMVSLPLINGKDTCDVFEKYQIGNIGSTIRGFCKDKYFREDRYASQHIIILFESINKSKLIFLNSIMDNVKIELIGDVSQ